MTFFARPLKHANFHREYYLSCVTSCDDCTRPTVFLTDMTESTELQAFKRPNDGYKFTVKIFLCICVVLS